MTVLVYRDGCYIESKGDLCKVFRLMWQTIIKSAIIFDGFLGHGIV